MEVEPGSKTVAKVTTTEVETVKEVNDLAVVVDNPEKHVTAMESYITFRVVTKVTLMLEYTRLCTHEQIISCMYLSLRCVLQ